MTQHILPQVPAGVIPANFKEWTFLQEAHAKVTRWNEYRDCNSLIPMQNNLQHLASFRRMADRELLYIGQHSYIHPERVIACIDCHDDGEALLQSDVLYHNKSSDRDVEEYLAFRGFVAHLPNRYDLLQSFLLQFITGDIEPFFFDKETQSLISEVKVLYKEDGIVFNFLEKLDYVHFALWAYQVAHDPVILTHVLRNQVPALDGYAGEFPMMRIQAWTSKTSDWAHEFMERYKDLPGPKGEGGLPAAYEAAYQAGYMRRPLKFGVTVRKEV